MESKLVSPRPIGARLARLGLLLGCLALSGYVEASTYPLPPAGQFMVGQLQDTRVQAGGFG